MNTAHPVHCPKCDILVSASVQTEWAPVADPSVDAYGEIEEVQYSSAYQILSCPKCENAFLSKEIRFSTPDTSGTSSVEILYPSASLSDFKTVPKYVVQVYREAKTNAATKSYISATIMVRKAIESIAKESGYAKGTLAEKIDRMKCDGIIDSKIAEWFHLLRLEGNDAAHQHEYIVDEYDALDCIAFLEAIVQNVFTLNLKFKEFQARRAQRALTKRSS